MELVLLLPLLAPFVVVGRLVDMWNTWRGRELPTLLESASDAEWEQTWGRMLSGSVAQRLSGSAPAPHPAQKT